MQVPCVQIAPAYQKRDKSQFFAFKVNIRRLRHRSLDNELMISSKYIKKRNFMTLHIVQIKMRSREQLLTREATKPKRLGAEENHLEDSHEAQM